MEKYALKVNKRSIAGKKVKKLRANGELPANIYGKKITSEMVSIPLKDFQSIYKKVGENGLVYVTIDGETKERPILFHNIQRHPINDMLLHVDLYQVDLKEKITSRIPLVLINEAKAVIDKIGVVIQPLAEIEVEALPADLPEKIEVDITNLATIDQALTVKDLVIDSSKVTILTSDEETVAKIGPLITKEMEEQLAAEKAAAEAASATVPVEGAAPTSEGGEQAPGVEPEEKKEVPNTPTQS